MHVYFNGRLMPAEQVSIHFEDRGYQFADGIYEVVRIYNNRLIHLQPHLDRLAASAAGIELDLPTSLEELRLAMEALVEANEPGDGILYLQVSRGVSPRSHQFPSGAQPTIIMYTRELPRPLANLRNGVACITVPDDRWLRCNIKSISLLPNILAKQKAARAKVYEAIFIRDGRVTEGSSSNILCVKGGTIYTHPANNLVLNGITRQVIARLAADLEIPFEERAFDLPFLLAADEVIDSSTTSEITPVVRVDGQMIGDGQPGPIARALQEAFESEILRESGRAWTAAG